MTEIVNNSIKDQKNNPVLPDFSPTGRYILEFRDSAGEVAFTALAGFLGSTREAFRFNNIEVDLPFVLPVDVFTRNLVVARAMTPGKPE